MQAARAPLCWGLRGAAVGICKGCWHFQAEQDDISPDFEVNNPSEVEKLRDFPNPLNVLRAMCSGEHLQAITAEQGARACEALRGTPAAGGSRDTIRMRHGKAKMEVSKRCLTSRKNLVASKAEGKILSGLHSS